MQCTWTNRFQLWPERGSTTYVDDLGEYCWPCQDYLRPRHKQRNEEKNEGLHSQAWIYWIYTVKTQTACGNTQPLDCKAKWDNGSEDIHADSVSGIWELRVSNHQSGYDGKLDRWGNLQGFKRSVNSFNRCQENRTWKCMTDIQREETKDRK